MNTLWCWLMVTSCMAVLVTGNAGAAAEAWLQCGQGAVQLMLTLLGTMTLWSGLMEILVSTGDFARVGKLLRRLLAPLFPGLKDEACWSAMGMNMAANILGLGNAATPAGVQAAQLLEKQGDAGVRALAMMLALNNSGLQLIPTTVITLRSAAGAANPADVWLPSLLSSGAATLAAAGMMLLLNKGGARRG